ncbi:MAG: CDP-diacylglycerol--glycerol-3-phosphate 3-phosphatidyltransferase [Pseudomonadota bacterium]
MNWTLPNILTVVRLAAAPLLGLVFLLLPRPWADIAALFLFTFAALTDYIDGYLARKWNQISKFGAMLDPIADKAMVIIALGVLLGVHGMTIWLTLPIVVILFRETFVSGLREFLGDTAGTLKVTQLAKWKTTVQMVAIGFLFAWGIFDHYVVALTIGMDMGLVAAVLNGEVTDHNGLWWVYQGLLVASYGGLLLLWIAGALTLMSGVDYFRKALPFLREPT